VTGRVAAAVRTSAPRRWLLGLDVVDRALVIGTSGTFVLNVTQTLLNFALTLTLAHALGAAGIGAYAYAFAWAAVLSVPSVLGLTPLVVRHVAGYKTRGEWGLLRGLLASANRAVLLSSAVFVTGGAIVCFAVNHSRPEFLYPTLIGLLLVPVVAVTSIRQAAMQGLGRVVLGRTPETLIAPALFLSLVVVGWLVLGRSLTASWAIALQVTGSFVALLVGVVFLRRVLPRRVAVEHAEYEMRSWVMSAIPLLLFSLVQAINAQIDVILLGGIDGAHDAGVYSVVARVGGLVTFVMIVVGYPLSPLIARLHTSGETVVLQRTVRRAAIFVFLAALPVALFVIAFAAPLLRLFGSEFDAGETALVLTVIGQLVFAATGFSGTVLVMTGRESMLMRGVVVGAVVNVILNIVLIPPFGLNGAAIATVFSIATMNVCLVYYARRRAGIATTAFGI
jgi:O-antigen/teichoic acid export membrane protein